MGFTTDNASVLGTLAQTLICYTRAVLENAGTTAVVPLW